MRQAPKWVYCPPDGSAVKQRRVVADASASAYMEPTRSRSRKSTPCLENRLELARHDPYPVVVSEHTILWVASAEIFDRHDDLPIGPSPAAATNQHVDVYEVGVGTPGAAGVAAEVPKQYRVTLDSGKNVRCAQRDRRAWPVCVRVPSQRLAL